jgi:Tol biopolymer transport system component
VNSDVLEDVNSFYNPYDPEFGADGTRLYFAPSDGVNPQLLQLATRDDNGDTFESVDVPGITTNTNYSVADPWISADEKLLLFSQVLVDQTDVDLKYAVKGANGDFGAVMPVPSINTSPAAESDPWLSPKGCRLYFSSTRGGNYDLYVANAK